ncbi:hypothetical protein CHARACLAT_017526 [Characodon lateralis]|uniref:Uncharacterized protein n=1 Tax=Characodon lateralis TaxID=208331 RepID=A0ABU7D7L8_9TELE|nr:hypothetical protein [Characodon lateralis]
MFRLVAHRDKYAIQPSEMGHLKIAQTDVFFFFRPKGFYQASTTKLWLSGNEKQTVPFSGPLYIEISMPCTFHGIRLPTERTSVHLQIEPKQGICTSFRLQFK